MRIATIPAPRNRPAMIGIEGYQPPVPWDLLVSCGYFWWMGSSQDSRGNVRVCDECPCYWTSNPPPPQKKWKNGHQTSLSNFICCCTFFCCKVSININFHPLKGVKLDISAAGFPSHRQASRFPFSAAMCSGVQPSWKKAIGCSLASRNSRTRNERYV